MPDIHHKCQLCFVFSGGEYGKYKYVSIIIIIMLAL